MAIVQISQITNRKGLAADLPQLAGAEFGWSTDTRQLFIGNGTLEDGAPVIGNTEILTEFSDILNISRGYTYKGTAAGYIVQTGPTPASPVAQNLQEWLDQYASVKDFGAVGDGVTDDTDAINRALNQLYCQVIQSPGIRRSLFFPAGVYLVSNTINIPSYATLVGEGADNSIIQMINGNTNSAVYVAQTADNLQNTGFSIVTAPTNITISNMAFQSLDATVSTFLIQSAKNCRFHNVSFIGNTTNLSTDTPGTHGVAYGSTGIFTTNSIVFDGCSFSNTTWGLQSEEVLEGIVVTNSKFNTLYQGVNLSTGATGFRITDNTFDNIHAEGVVFGSSVSLNATGYNIFYNVGNGNTTGTGTLTPSHPIINIYGDNNVSIGDMFERDATLDLSYPRVKLNDSRVIATVNGEQLELGQYIIQTALSATLTVGTGNITFNNNSANAVAGFSVNYTLTGNSYTQIGTLMIVSGNVIDSNVQTGDTNPMTISYTNSGVANATMKYSISYFTN